MNRFPRSRPGRAALAAMAVIVTALPSLAVTASPAVAVTAGPAGAGEQTASPARAGKQAARPAGAGKQKYHHRTKVGAQIVRAMVIDTSPGVEGGKVVDLRIGRASSNINTRKASPAVSTSKTLGGRGLGDNDLSGLLTAMVAKAGPGKGEERIPPQTLVPIPAAPLLTMGVSSGGALARWNGPKTCVAGRKAVTRSTSSTADLALLPEQLPDSGSLLLLDGTAKAIQKTTYLPRGKKAGLKGVATTALADLELFGGAVGVEVVADPRMVATAKGRKGKAKIAYTPAVLEITGPDGDIVALPADGAPAEIEIPGDPLINVLIQTPGIIKEKISANGRVAKAKSVTLRAVLKLGGQVVADLAIAPLQTKAKVPRGGVTCRR